MSPECVGFNDTDHAWEPMDVKMKGPNKEFHLRACRRCGIVALDLEASE